VSLRIALVSTPYVPVPPPGYGGTELVIHHLVRGLREEGAEVTLYATGDSRLDDGERPRFLFERAIWPPDPAVDARHQRFALADARESGAEVVHVHSPLGLEIAAASHLPVVCTVHHAVEDGFSPIYAARPAGAVIVAISARQRALDPALAGAVVIHHGLDPRAYPPSVEPGRGVVYLGRLSPAKGVERGIDAALRAGRPIQVAGQVHAALEPDAAPYFARELAPRFALEGVDWVGEVGGHAKRELLRSAAALVLPIAWEEPFGLVLIEAMLSGTPVAAFACGSVPEIVEEGVTGFTAPAGDVDALADAIDRAARLDRRAVSARAVARWSHRRMARAYLDAYAAARSRAPAARVRARRARREPPASLGAGT
jgi:glycosyltransferase involved in cell wall biosynthesis